MHTIIEASVVEFEVWLNNEKTISEVKTIKVKWGSKHNGKREQTPRASTLKGFSLARTPIGVTDVKILQICNSYIFVGI
jgi:hypothetical protein